MTRQQKMDYYEEIKNVDKEAANEFYEQIIAPAQAMGDKVVKKKKVLKRSSNNTSRISSSKKNRTILTKKSLISDKSGMTRTQSNFQGSKLA